MKGYVFANPTVQEREHCLQYWRRASGIEATRQFAGGRAGADLGVAAASAADYWQAACAWRAVQEATLRSKQILSVYYGGQSKHAYWYECSSGGKQGLEELQPFPADFDGALTGAPVNNWMRLQVQSKTVSIANLPIHQPRGLGMHQLELLYQAVISECDALDGVTDGEIAKPRLCHFKASSILCKPGQPAEECLTPVQAKSILQRVPSAPIRLSPTIPDQGRRRTRKTMNAVSRLAARVPIRGPSAWALQYPPCPDALIPESASNRISWDRNE